MTKEEKELTITYLTEMQEEYIEGEGYERHPLPEYYALDMVIKALEQQPCEDCVSRQAVDQLCYRFLSHSAHEIAFYEHFCDLPSVTPTQRWVPVSERMPEERTAVLVWCPERKNIYCACYEEKQWWIFGAYFEKITLEVTAWQPLPKPYEE